MDNKYTHTGERKKNFVENMFDKISTKYDIFNHVSTFYIDKYWRYKFIKKLNLKNESHVLDIATGTGDIIITICNKNSNLTGFGYDCSQNMLEIAKNKSKNKEINNIEYTYGYAENLPFKDNSMDIITISFGLRNFNDYEKKVLDRIS